MHTINLPYFFFKKTYPKTSFQTTFYYQNNEITEYKLEKIMDCTKRIYLIHWKGYLNFGDM